MHQLHMRIILQGNWALWQSPQPFEMLGTQLVAGPDSSGGGHGIEVIEFEQAGYGFVVIAANENFTEVTGAFDNVVGRGSVADEVAEVGDEIVGRSRGEASLQGFEVSVNVAEQQYAQ